MITELRFQLWSLKPLPAELINLTLPDYPFSKSNLGPLPDEVLKFFQQYQIIYYRDEAQPFGIVVQVNDGNPKPIIEREMFPAYRSSGMLNRKTLTIMEWTPKTMPAKFRKLVKKRGDAYAWFMWNRQVVIVEMNEEQVTCA